MNTRALIAGLMASTALAGTPLLAGAADLTPAYKAPQQTRQMVSGYLELEAGYAWMNNRNEEEEETFTGKDRKWLINGAGRVNVWLGSTLTTQFDVWGGADTFAKQKRFEDGPRDPVGNVANFNVGAHLSHRTPGYLVGVFGAVGGIGANGTFSPDPAGYTHATVGGEAQAYFGMLTLYAQVGYQFSLSPADFAFDTSGRDDFTAWFIRGVARYYVKPNLRLEAWAMYAAGKGGEDFLPVEVFFGDRFKMTHTAWGVGIEKKLENSPFAFFARYEGSWTKLSGDAPPFDSGYFFRSTQHMGKAGFRVYLNEETLFFNDRMGTTLDIRDAFTSSYRGMGRTAVGRAN
jgi:hypothetical protein